MKHITAGAALASCLLVTAFGANAEVLGSKRNQAGGLMFISTEQCGPEKTGKFVFSTDNSGQVILTGCAYPMGSKALIDWGGGDITVINDAWLVEEPKEPSKSDKSARYMEM